MGWLHRSIKVRILFRALKTALFVSLMFKNQHANMRDWLMTHDGKIVPEIFKQDGVLPPVLSARSCLRNL